MWRLPRPILVFLLMRLGALIHKILFLVTIVRTDLIWVSVLLLWWLVAILVFLSKEKCCINLSGWGKAWKSWAAKATITTAFFITPITLMVFSRTIWGLSVLKVLRRLRSRFLRPKRVLVENFFFGAFVRLGERSMAPKTVSIHFSDLKRKVKGGFALCGDDFFNSLLPGILPTAILFGLGTNKRPQAVAE